MNELHQDLDHRTAAIMIKQTPQQWFSSPKYDSLAPPAYSEGIHGLGFLLHPQLHFQDEGLPHETYFSLLSPGLSMVARPTTWRHSGGI